MATYGTVLYGARRYTVLFAVLSRASHLRKMSHVPS